MKRFGKLGFEDGDEVKVHGRDLIRRSGLEVFDDRFCGRGGRKVMEYARPLAPWIGGLPPPNDIVRWGG